jgi:putative transcriptional regulator
VIDPIICPGFLLADPQLSDDFFHRAVVGLVHSDSHGAFGVVLNKPSSFILADLFPETSDNILGTSTIFQGGPVEPERLFIFHNNYPNTPRSEFAIELAPGLIFEPNLPDLEQFLSTNFAGILRFYLGYAGWSEGQLENEMKERSWFSSQANSEVWTMNQGQSMWLESMKLKGPYHALIAQTGYRPSLN